MILAGLTAGKKTPGRRLWAMPRDGCCGGADFYAEATKAGGGAETNSRTAFRKASVETLDGGGRTNRPSAMNARTRRRAGGPVGRVAFEGENVPSIPVSYTHLDVYKRQALIMLPALSCQSP